MNETHTEYTSLEYGWKLFEDAKQIASGELQTNARLEYDSHASLLAGSPPVKVYHISAQKMCRRQADFQLRALGKYPSIGVNWGAWRGENDGDCRSAPLLVDGQEAFRIFLEVINDV